MVPKPKIDVAVMDGYIMGKYLPRGPGICTFFAIHSGTSGDRGRCHVLKYRRMHRISENQKITYLKSICVFEYEENT